MDTQTLACTKCESVKPIDQFTAAKRKLNGKSSLCRTCHQAASVAWQAANPEKVKATRRARYARKKASGSLPQRRYNTEQARELGRKRRYGVTAESYAEMLVRQDGRCAICRRPGSEFARPLAIDHDHSCCASTPTCGKCNRGLLCSSCNTAIHNAERDANWFSRAAAYLGGKL